MRLRSPKQLLMVLGPAAALLLAGASLPSQSRAEPIEEFGTTCSDLPDIGSAPPSFSSSVAGESVSKRVIQGVPAYNWYHGCGPTAAASIVGYWDLNGYSNLFDAAGDDVYLTENVKDQISSPDYNYVFDPTPDRDDTPYPERTSIANYFWTSRDPLNYGESYISQSVPAITGYADYRGYNFEAKILYHFNGTSPFYFGWDEFTAEIDAGRPLLFVVDTNGDNRDDHFVPVVGYEETESGARYYGMYTTWTEHEHVIWKEFRLRAAGSPWGVSYATFITPLDDPEPIPLPAGALLLLTGVAAFPLMARRRPPPETGAALP